jgi:hypothetical protein
MNNFKRKKLGLSKKDYLVDIRKSEQKISTSTPISLNKTIKDFNSYSKIDLKTINVGTLRKPIEKLVIFDNETQGYYPIEIKNESAPQYYFQETLSEIVLNGQVLTYQSNSSIDQNNPYDPLFASFNRLSSRVTSITIQSGVTGISQGEQQKFFALSSGFTKSQNIIVSQSSLPINGIFVPNGVINNKTRYVNSSNSIPVDMIWFQNNNFVSGISGFISVPTQSGWVLRQRDQWRLNFRPLYVLLGNNTLPTGNNWQITGSSSTSGSNPLPVSEEIELEGFFKLATTRISNGKNKIYSSVNGVVGNTSGNLPANNNWITYPHSYNIQSYPALRYNSVITFENNGNKISDIIIVSTGISSKKIVYVSPHAIENFAGFWAELSSSSRIPITGSNGRIINSRDVYLLQSGNLTSVSSFDYNYTGLNYITKITSGSSKRFYNFDAARLKQQIPLKDTLFYKLYEPVYRKNTFNTGTWNGIIPSGTPFSIETVRLKNSEITTPNLNVYISNAFILSSESGSGIYQYSENPSGLLGSGIFYGYKVTASANNQYEASYLASRKASKQAKSRLYGYLWSRGITKGNAKVRKMIDLMGRLDLVKNNPKDGVGRYCKTYINPSDPMSCSYTGYAGIPLRNRPGLPTGISTRAGFRLTNNNLIEDTFISGQKVEWKKVLPYDYATISDIPPGVFGCFTLSGGIGVCIDPPL